MKLQDLAKRQSSKQVSKVFESYFGNSISFDNLTKQQSRQLLNRVRNLVTEHKQSRGFHTSQRNPAYLKLMMMEQILTQKLSEGATGMSGSTGMTGVAGQNQQQNDPAAAAAAKQKQIASLSKIKDPTLQGAMKKSLNGQNLTTGEQQLVANAAMGGGQINELSKNTLGNYVKKANADVRNSAYSQGVEDGIRPTLSKIRPDWDKAKKRSKGIDRAVSKMAYESARHNSLRRRIYESEIQQAQVVLAAQDMVDQVQKVIEQMTSVQFKDLPALVQQIQNEIGQQEAVQFNSDASAALTNLVQSLQQSKVQLESAVGVVTGQAPQVPGADAGMPAPGLPADGAEMGADIGADIGADVGADLDADLDADLGGDEFAPPPGSLGRKKR